MDARQLLEILRRAWWLPLTGLLIGGAAGLVFSLVSPRLYTSETQLFVSATDASSTSSAYQGSQFVQQRVASYARLLSGEELAGRVSERLDLDLAPRQVAEKIEATALTDTVLLNVVVVDESPDRAQRIASTLGNEFVQYVAELETPEAGGASPVKVTITDEPEVPGSSSSPDWLRNTAVGLLGGLALGGAVAVGRNWLDRSVKDPDEVGVLAGAPVIGTVLRDEALEKRHTIDRASASRTAEDYRQLRTNLQFINVDEPPKVIMISSAIPSEGKTTAVVNLGLALADAGRKVTIVEADLRKPKVTRSLGLVGGVGLTNILAGTADLEEVIQRYGSGELSVIASGPTPPNPGELLVSSHMFSLLDKLRAENDFVLVDAPPLLPVADSTGLAVFMDGVVLSVRYGSTRKEQLQQAAATLERVGARTLGVILNIVPPKAELATAYGYAYAYGYDQPGKGATAAE